VLGAKKGSPLARKIFAMYKETKEFTEMSGVQIFTVAAKKVYNIGTDGKTALYDGGFKTFAPEVFYPIHFATGAERRTKETMARHLWHSTWHGEWEKLEMRAIRLAYKINPSGSLFEGLTQKCHESRIERIFEKGLS
jgi:hypothetical protein